MCARETMSWKTLENRQLVEELFLPISLSSWQVHVGIIPTNVHTAAAQIRERRKRYAGIEIYFERSGAREICTALVPEIKSRRKARGERRRWRNRKKKCMLRGWKLEISYRMKVKRERADLNRKKNEKRSHFYDIIERWYFIGIYYECIRSIKRQISIRNPIFCKKGKRKKWLTI